MLTPAPSSTGRAFLFELAGDKDIHFARIFKGKIIDDGADESVDEHLFGTMAVDAAGLEVEEEVFVDLAGGCLVADGTGTVPYFDNRYRIGDRSRIKNESIAFYRSY